MRPPAQLAKPPAPKPEVALPAAAPTLRAGAAAFTPGAVAYHVDKTPAKSEVSTELDSASEVSSTDLPAVISVKKSSRGCAVVLIRDPKVVERGVRQSVAVVDGVCVEVREHTPRRAVEDGEAEEKGLFIAWGSRVERKVTITVEGIEAYFNALAHAPCVDSLEVLPPFEERCLSFPLRSSGPLLPLSAAPHTDRPERARMLGGEFCCPALVARMWEQKQRLDDLWNIPPPPLARSLMTRVARAQLFPHSGEGGKEHENRAGDKLAELSRAVGLLDGVPPGACFLDLCGGPGAWSQHLLAQRGLCLRGFGFTLRSEAGGAEDWQAEEKDQWYPELFRDSRWRALWGADGSGDLLKPGNIQHCAQQIAKEGLCFLCVADGGFSDKAIPPNQLELYFYRLLLGELLMAVSCLQPGGRFVCKMYTAFSVSTNALLYLTTRLFASATIVKPMSSRATGPERYLYAAGFRGAACKEVAAIRAALLREHELCAGASPLTAPLLSPVVSAAALAGDGAFAAAAREAAEALCARQAAALQAVVDRAGELEELAMSVAQSAGTAEPASYEKIAKDRADYEKHKQRKQDALDAQEEAATERMPWNRRPATGATGHRQDRRRRQPEGVAWRRGHR